MKDFNFFRPFLDNESLSLKTRLTIVIVSILIFVSMAGLHIGNRVKISGLHREIKSMENMLSSPKTKNIENDLLVNGDKYKKMQQYFEELKKISVAVHNKDIVNSELIRKISSTTPEKVFFQSISMNDKGVQIQCSSDSTISAAELLHNMKALGIFEDVYIPGLNSASQDVNTQYSFTLMCTLKGGENNENENKQ